MRPEKLAAMANQIAGFFRSYEEDEAVAGIHRHIEAFWTPAMRQTLLEHVIQSADGVDPLVLAALRRDPAVSSPVDKVLSPVRSSGAMASDAG